MTYWLFGFLVLTDLHQLTLENHGQFINTWDEGLAVLDDGSFLILGEHKINHFSDKGKLLQRFGAKGQGPGEFVRIGHGIYVTPKEGQPLYLIHDPRTGSYNSFDGEGRFIKRHKSWYRKLFVVDGDLYGFDIHQAFRKRDLQKPLYRLKPDGSGGLHRLGEGFHRVRQISLDFGFNQPLFFLDADADYLYVVDEFVAEVSRYRRDSLKPAGTLSFDLKGFRQPEGKPDYQLPRKKLRAWFASYSYVKYFGILDEGYLLAYTLPETETGETPLLFQAFDRQRHPRGEPVRLRWQGYMGVHDGNAYFLQESEDAEAFEMIYTIVAARVVRQ